MTTSSSPGLSSILRLRSEEHTSELQSQSNLVCRLLLEKKKHLTRPLSCCLWLPAGNATKSFRDSGLGAARRERAQTGNPRKSRETHRTPHARSSKRQRD